MASRFQVTSAENVQALKEKCRNKNTDNSTCTWIRIYKSWAQERVKKTELEEYSPEDLNQVLEQFYAEVRKRDGSPYEPDCLLVMQARLLGYLKEKGYAKDIVNDECFAGANKVLEGNARNLRETGLGKRPNRACSLTEEEEDILWDCGLLGDSSPKALLNTMWLLLCQHFGLRGRQEHHDMMVKYFTTRKCDYGKNYITFSESYRNTKGGSLKVKHRLQQPKMFEIPGLKRCPVRLFNIYLSKRPPAYRKTGPFYVQMNSSKKDPSWYRMSPLGKNSVGDIMKNMKLESPLIEISADKKLTIHSARKNSCQENEEGRDTKVGNYYHNWSCQ